MILGVVLAGGNASRFGSDKALALLDGISLMDHAINSLTPHCDKVVVAGRQDGASTTLADWPQPGMGPLGGLAAALRYASTHGYPLVLSVAVDSLGLPVDLHSQLSPAPAYAQQQPVIGLWPSSASTALNNFLTAPGKNSVMAFAKTIGARPVALDKCPYNINTLADLAALQSAAQARDQA
jgi:molybdopterin-guanine dinucleotide biosynthesis protein A